MSTELVVVETNLVPVDEEVGPAALVDAGTVLVNPGCNEGIKILPLSIDTEVLSDNACEEIATVDADTCLAQAEVEPGILIAGIVTTDDKTGPELVGMHLVVRAFVFVL